VATEGEEGLACRGPSGVRNVGAMAVAHREALLSWALTWGQDMGHRHGCDANMSVPLATVLVAGRAGVCHHRMRALKSLDRQHWQHHSRVFNVSNSV